MRYSTLQKKWKRLLLILPAILLCSTLVSCGSSSSVPPALAESSSSGTPPTLGELRNYISIPLAMQATDYTCGVAALQSVLGYYGENIRQDVLAEALGVNEQDGTRYLRIVEYAQSKGYAVQVNQNMTIENLKGFIDQKLPVIVLIQAWPDAPVDWATDYDDGHYVVAVGYDQSFIYFMDPFTLGNITYIPPAEFVERWHDKDGDGSVLIHFGMIISKGAPSYDPQKLLPMN
jgi:predicted double-glycine peptidase